jgi:hypothetical protein
MVLMFDTLFTTKQGTAFFIGLLTYDIQKELKNMKICEYVSIKFSI